MLTCPEVLRRPTEIPSVFLEQCHHLISVVCNEMPGAESVEYGSICITFSHMLA